MFGAAFADTQPRSQGLSSLPPFVVGTETLVAAGHVTTQNLGGRKIYWKGGVTVFCSRPNVLEYPPTLRFWMDKWSRDQPQTGSLFQRLRDPGNEVGRHPEPLSHYPTWQVEPMLESNQLI